jgi:hypothetical protein
LKLGEVGPVSGGCGWSHISVVVDAPVLGTLVKSSFTAHLTEPTPFRSLSFGQQTDGRVTPH